MPAKRSSGPGGQLARVTETMPSWVAAMREAAMSEIGDADVREIVRNQVVAAKAGDRNAIRFVFEQVLGGAALKGATFVQNNYGADGELIEGLVSSSPEARRARVRHAAAAEAARDDPLRWYCNECGHEHPATGARPETQCPKCHGVTWRPVAPARKTGD